MVAMDMHNQYSKLPLIAAGTWFVTLLILLLTWIGEGRPIYSTQPGVVAYISDVGSSFMKPLFVIGATITAIAFVLTLVAERQLQHSFRLLPTQRRAEAILSYCAIGGAVLGGLGLILLSGFDTLRYPSLHRIFLFVFMLGVMLSAIFSIVEFHLLSRSYKSYTLLRRQYMVKGVVAFVLLVLAFAFGALLFQGGPRWGDIAGILEWVIGFGVNLYFLTFWYDLKQAAPRYEEAGALANGVVQLNDSAAIKRQKRQEKARSVQEQVNQSTV